MLSVRAREPAGGHAPQRLPAAVGAVDDLGQRGTDKFYGKGRINVARTLDLE